MRQKWSFLTCVKHACFCHISEVHRAITTVDLAHPVVDQTCGHGARIIIGEPSRELKVRGFCRNKRLNAWIFPPSVLHPLLANTLRKRPKGILLLRKIIPTASPTLGPRVQTYSPKRRVHPLCSWSPPGLNPEIRFLSDP